jgi:hypothetical protein
MSEPKVHHRVEYAVIEDRTHLGLGYVNLWTTSDLARAKDHAEQQRLDGKSVQVKTRRVVYTDWTPLPADPPLGELEPTTEEDGR